MFDYKRDIRYLDRTERRVAVVTPLMRWIHLVQAVQEAYNHFKRVIELNSKSL
jgi:hypothetical protein